MQARIRKDELITFKAEASDIILGKESLPVLVFLRIQIEGDFATIIKSNMRSFIVKTIPNDSEDCLFLVHEQTLYDFLEAADTDFISFESIGTRILISSGRAKIYSPTEMPHIYPKIDIENSEWTLLPKTATSTAGICSKIILSTDLMVNAQSHVFIGKHFAAGADGSIGYYQAIAEQTPILCLRKEVAQCVSKMSNCQVSYNASYDLFKSGQTLFGFSKSEIGFFDAMGGLFKGKLDDKWPQFSCSKNNILRFTNLCIARAPKANGATFEIKEENNLYLELIVPEENLDIHLDIQVKGKEAKFKFNPTLLANLLKVVPSEDVFFYPGNHQYFISDLDRSYVAVIMETN
jgi:hypothetical protein